MQHQSNRPRPASGNAYRMEGKRGPVWYMRYRLPDGTESRRKIGPAWTGRGRPPEGFFTKRTAQAALDAFLTDARRGVLPELRKTGATVKDAAEEWLRYEEHERHVKPSTLADYHGAVRTHIVPAFGDRRIEEVTTRAIERWQTHLATETSLSPRTRNKLLTILHGIFERARRVWGLRTNPVADVQRPPERYSGDYDFFSPEEVWALVRAAESEQDAAIFLTAAFTGLRMGELRALRWRDVDFANEVIHVRRGLSNGVLSSPKGRLVRSVPMIEDVAKALEKLSRESSFFTGDDDLVFPSIRSAERVERLINEVDWSEEQDEVLVSGYLDRSALRRRYKKALRGAGLRDLRFHDLRHTFGSLAINRGSPVEVQAWLGHSDFKTTQRYLHHKSRADEARRLAEAFRPATSLEEALNQIEEAEPA